MISLMKTYKGYCEFCLLFLIFGCYFFREFAKLLVRYTDDTKDLMRQLRKVTKQSNESVGGKETYYVLYHELIKKMPGSCFCLTFLLLNRQLISSINRRC